MATVRITRRHCSCRTDRTSDTSSTLEFELRIHINDQEVAMPEITVMGCEGQGGVPALLMGEQALTSACLPAAMWGFRQVVILDLSRNCLDEVPGSIGNLVALQLLDVSRNRLMVLPKALGSLRSLVVLAAQSNKLRPAARSLPLAEFAQLPALRLIDLRFNPKLKSAGPLLAATLPQKAQAMLLGPTARCRQTRIDPAAVSLLKALAAAGGGGGRVCPNQILLQHVPRKRSSPATADATQLRAQLEPHHTGALRRRLVVDFGRTVEETDPRFFTREDLMDLLLRCYAVEGPNARVVRAIPGHHPVQPALAAALEAELRKTDWAATKKERPTVRAAGYVTFQHPRCHSRSGTGRLTKAARTNLAKLRHFDALWKLIVKTIEDADPTYATRFSSVAVSKDFVGSPHTDSYDRAPQYALSLGHFTGGELMVEANAREVVAINTHGRMAKCDGRFPHWVAPYSGERYSIIWFTTSPEYHEEMATAVFS